MSGTRWWNWKPSTFVRVSVGAALLLVVGAVASHALTGNWGRAWSYAIGFTTVWIVVESLRVRRGEPDPRPDNLPPYGEPPIG